MTNREKIIAAFRKVKAAGWIKSHRHNDTGIGKTFEDSAGVAENNRKSPDLFGYEIKSHRKDSKSRVSLFTKSPSHPRRGANTYLKERYGELYTGSSTLKKIHTSIFANRPNIYAERYSFQLINDRNERRIYITVFSADDGTILDRTVYYTYDDIERALATKLHNLLYVKASSKIDDNGEEWFNYTSADIYTSPSLESFLEMLDKGEIMCDIRIGAFLSGSKAGKPHDHGNCFRINESALIRLYSRVESIE